LFLRKERLDLRFAATSPKPETPLVMQYLYLLVTLSLIPVCVHAANRHIHSVTRKNFFIPQKLEFAVRKSEFTLIDLTAPASTDAANHEYDLDRPFQKELICYSQLHLEIL
jgi:hypothetical protein